MYTTPTTTGTPAILPDAVAAGKWQHTACGTTIVWVATAESGYACCPRCLVSPPRPEMQIK